MPGGERTVPGSPLKLKGPCQGTGRPSVAVTQQPVQHQLLWASPQSLSHRLYSQPLPLSNGEHILTGTFHQMSCNLPLELMCSKCRSSSRDF